MAAAFLATVPVVGTALGKNTYAAVNNILVKYRHYALAITLVLAAVCGVLMLHVNVNTDMTKYLPADSPMKVGLDIMQHELGMGGSMDGASVRVMTQGQTDEQQVEMRYSLLQLPHVESVTLQHGGERTLYELGVAKQVDQIALAKHIKAEYPDAVAVETSQDGTTADSAMLVGGLALLMLVLVAMCASWLEPVLFLASTGVAVLLNMGTNALLPSVSVTTHSITAILQLVLSMDYSIILLNRYRQQRATAPDSLAAMRQAIGLAAPSVISSALTTIVGLMMLVFMKLRIGADLGIVLSKGVFFSLVCNFTVLPSLILIFEKGIQRSQKRVLTLPTDKLARFSLRHRVPLMVFFVVLLVGSYWMHNRTPISFLNAKESVISQYFPPKNPVVIIYDNADHERMLTLVDSLNADPAVEMSFSYPSLMLKRYDVQQMLSSVRELSSLVGDAQNDADLLPLDMLSEDVLRLVYYAAFGKTVPTLDFQTLANFILSQSRDPGSFLASQMDDDMKAKMAMFEDFRQMDNDLVNSEELIVNSEQLGVNGEQLIVNSEELIVNSEQLGVNSEQPAANIQQPTANSQQPTANSQQPIADTARIHQPMTSDMMAQYLGMEASQAKMVFRLAKRAGQKMSPLQFVHFLTDDILKRKALASMISSEQRQQLLALRATMDSASTAADLVETPSPTAVSVVAEAAPVATSTEQADLVQGPSHDTVALASAIEDADDPLSVLDEMMTTRRRYTATQMARNFSAMGEAVDPALIQLLYMYYSGINHFDQSWKMSLGEMLSFLGDSLMNDPRFSTFITQSMREQMAEGRRLMDAKLGMLHSHSHSVAVVVTGLPTESDSTYAFLDRLVRACDSSLTAPYYLVGESVMLREMKGNFGHEMALVTLLTILAIFVIVAFTFRSWLTALLLVSTVMTGVFVDVSVSAIGGGSLLFMAYLVVQSILMGSAIDYGILFTHYYREHRATSAVGAALCGAYRQSIHTILTSGLILILVPGAMSFTVADPTVASIVRAISVGALATVLLVLLVLPGMLAICDKYVVVGAKKK